MSFALACGLWAWADRLKPWLYARCGADGGQWEAMAALPLWKDWAVSVAIPAAWVVLLALAWRQAAAADPAACHAGGRLAEAQNRYNR